MSFATPRTARSGGRPVSARFMDSLKHRVRQEAGRRARTPRTPRTPGSSPQGKHKMSPLASRVRDDMAKPEAPRHFTFDRRPSTSSSGYGRPKSVASVGSCGAELDSAGFKFVGEKCICEICTCGGHFCPLHPKRSEPFFGSTEAGDAWKGHGPVAGTKAYKPREQGIGMGHGRLVGDTENRQQFPGHKPPPAAARPSVKWEPNNLKFNGKTTAGDAFVRMPVEKREAYKPPARSKGSSVPFESKTEAQTSFTGQRPAAARPETPVDDRLKSQKFKGRGTHQASYPRHPLPEKARKQAAAAKKSVPFAGSSTYADMAGGYDFTIDEGGDMAAYRRPADKSLPFDGSGTEAQRAFQAHPMADRARPSRPGEHGIGVGEGRFVGDTENRQQFPGHKPPPAAARPSAKWEPNNLKFNGKTTAGDAFVRMPVEKREAYKPPARSKGSSVKFESKTEAQTSFTGQRPAAARPETPVDDRLKSQKFKGRGTHQASYPRHPLPEKARKQAAAAKKSVPFAGSSTYADMAGGYDIPIEHHCPVEDIYQAGIDPDHPKPSGPPSKNFAVSKTRGGHRQKHRFKQLTTKGHHLYAEYEK